LLRSSATEAFSELQKDKKPTPVGAEAFRAFLEASGKGKVTDEDASRGLSQRTNSAERVQRYESATPATPAGAKKAPLRTNSIAY
jgi:hypothetical protein